MAAISAIVGGTLGFVFALMGLFAFHLTALQALSLWSGTGVLTLGVLMVWTQFAPGGHARPTLKYLAKRLLWLHLGAAKS